MATSDAPNTRRLARQLVDVTRRLKHLETVPQLSNSSLDNQGMHVYDADGNVSVTLGKQSDGTYSARPVAGPPPPAPVGLDAEGDAGLVHATWQGVFWAGAAMPRDFEAVEVLVDGNVQGAIHDPEGGSVAVPAFAGEREVSFRTLSEAGRRSDVTGHVTVEVQSKASVQLDEARDRIDEAKADSAAALDRADDAKTSAEDAGDRLDVVESETIPGVEQAIQDAQEQFGQDITDAEARAIQEAQALAEQARQDAEGSAATDAQAKADAARDAAIAEAEAKDQQVRDDIDGVIDQARDELESDIDSVRQSANGKNTVHWSTSTPPSQYDGVTDDTWFRMSSMGSGGRVISQWRWNGNVWVSTTVDNAVIANLDAGKITSGFIDSDRIQAGSIYADKIVSGLSQNMVPDPGFSNSEINAARLSRAPGYGATFTVEGGVLTASAPDGVTNQPNFPLIANSDLYGWGAYPAMPVVANAQVRTVGEGSVASFRYTIRIRMRDGTTTYTAMTPTSFSPVTSEWEDFEAHYELPQEAVGFSVVLQWHNTLQGAVEARSPFVASSIGTTVIEDGAVTTDKVMAGAIDAGKIAAGAIEAEHIVAGGIEADSLIVAGSVGETLIEDGAITTDKVRADAIGANAIAAGVISGDHIIAGGIQADEVLVSSSVGSTLIKDGAVTTSKLTVTDEMSANVVNAMDVATKKLVVSEEAILNHATLIGDTVVDDINVQGKLIGTDGVFTGTVDFENVNVTGLQLVEKLEAHSISADLIEGGAFTGESFTGGTFIGGEFRTSDTLPGRVTLADDAYINSTTGVAHPGIRVEPLDTSDMVRPPGIGPGDLGLYVDGGSDTSGRRSYLRTSPTASLMRTFREGGTGGGSIQTSPTASLMRTYREDGTTGGVIQTSPTASSMRTYREDGTDGGVIQTSPTASLMRTYREDGTDGGVIQTSPDSSLMRTYSGNSSEQGWVRAQPQEAELAYVDPNNVYFSRIRATDTEAHLFTRAGGSNRYLTVDADGVWVKTNKGGSWKQYNLEETAQDSGWISFPVKAGITASSNLAYRNKNGVIYFRGTVNGDWGQNVYTDIVTGLPASMRPASDTIALSPDSTDTSMILRMTSDGTLRVWKQNAGRRTAWLSILSYPLG